MISATAIVDFSTCRLNNFAISNNILLFAVFHNVFFDYSFLTASTVCFLTDCKFFKSGSRTNRCSGKCSAMEERVGNEFNRTAAVEVNITVLPSTRHKPQAGASHGGGIYF